ncbi:MAG: type IX secretion system membrane protein PorP/SprF [Bacteroidetes bacterium]|nr:type IX secretion system membrane protein PorP/SprF [Bacteroidota bacterium]
MRVKLVVTSLLLLVLLHSQAQQRPHYTQYVINPFIINPAIAGIDNYGDLKVSGRDQWVGLKGAPRTTYLTLHAPLGKNDYRLSSTSYAVPGNNPRGKSYWENYTAAEPHHGVGVSIINDRTGSFNFLSASASYAYHLGLNPTTNISAGLSAGLTTIRIDRTNHDFTGFGNPSDPAFGSVVTGELRKIRPQMAAGIWLYARSYFIGFSAQQIIPQTVSFVNNDPAILTKSKLIPHLFLTAGYRFMLGEDFNVIPSIMAKYIRGSTRFGLQPEFNAKLQYRDVLWIGGSYRYRDSYAGMLGLNMGNRVTLSYSYDLPIKWDLFRDRGANILSPFHNGTHELVIGFQLGNKYSEACPRCY